MGHPAGYRMLGREPKPTNTSRARRPVPTRAVPHRYGWRVFPDSTLPQPKDGTNEKSSEWCCRTSPEETAKTSLSGSGLYLREKNLRRHTISRIDELSFLKMTKR